MISLQRARDSFAEIDTFGDDDIARAEAWNNYTDSLTKDGELCALQYHYAPAVDEPMPGAGTSYDALADDREYILECMGVTLGCERTDNPGTWTGDPGASHWRVTLSRGGQSYATSYHMGSAHTGEPELCDVVYSLLSDAAMVDQYDDLDEFAENLGITKPSEAITAWDACQRTAAAMRRLFGGDMDDMRELFEGY